MIILIFIFGLIVGSFLNAVIHRLHSGQSIFEPSSKCPKCGHELAWRDLLPIVSFFMLQGRCRYCDKPISWQYPLVELATAIAFTLIYTASVIPANAGIPPLIGLEGISGSPIESGMIMSMLFQFVFTSLLIIIFVYDLKHYLILDKVIIPGAILALIYQIWQGNFFGSLWGALALSGFFALLYFFSKGRWLGLGDVKLGIFLGILIPWPQTLVLFLLSYGIGAAVSLILIAWGRKKLTDKIPFGTFLTLAAFIAMLWGEGLIRWYFGLIY